MVKSFIDRGLRQDLGRVIITFAKMSRSSFGETDVKFFCLSFKS